MFKFMLFISLLLPILATAGSENFTKGPVFDNYGENVPIINGLIKPEKQKFKVIFDFSEAARLGESNRSFNTVARFINMHVRAGVPIENIDVAMVVHGKAGFDLMANKFYKSRFEMNNENQELVTLLLEQNVKVIICGQSASYLDIHPKQLISGVDMALSAMTANALLQQQGYTLNPF